MNSVGGEGGSRGVRSSLFPPDQGLGNDPAHCLLFVQNMKLVTDAPTSPSTNYIEN